MLFKSGTITSASGSFGGITASHNSSGMYFRARSIPVNPSSIQQDAVRSAMTEAVNRWTEVLTPDEREAWNAYALNVLVTNPLGDQVLISGQNWYVGSATPRLQANAVLGESFAAPDTAPVIFDRGDFTTPTSQMNAAAGLSITFENTDEWANEAGSAMLIFQARPTNPSRLFFKGPYRLIGAILGDDVTPPTSPVLINTTILNNIGFPLVEGQATEAVVAVVRADGRYSTRRVALPFGGITLGRQLVLA